MASILIDSFIKDNSGKEPVINSAITENDKLGDKKRDKFDVVADQIFKPSDPLPILNIIWLECC